MKSIVLFMFILFSSVTVLSGCSGIIDTDTAVKAAFTTGTTNESAFYNFLKNSNYEVKDITNLKSTSNSISFNVKQSVIYKMYLSNSNKLVTEVEAPNSKDYLSDFKNTASMGSNEDNFDEISLQDTIDKSFNEQKSHVINLKNSDIKGVVYVNKDKIKVRLESSL